MVSLSNHEERAHRMPGKQGFLLSQE